MRCWNGHARFGWFAGLALFFLGLACSSELKQTPWSAEQEKIMALVTSYDTLATAEQWQALGGKDPEAYAQQIIALYHRHDQLPVYQVRLLDGLGHLPSQDGEAFLLQLLERHSPYIAPKRQAYASLLRLNSKKVLTQTPSLMSRGHERLRIAYLQELLKRPEPEAEVMLRQLLRQESSAKIKRQIKAGLIRRFKEGAGA